MTLYVVTTIHPNNEWALWELRADSKEDAEAHFRRFLPCRPPLSVTVEEKPGTVEGLINPIASGKGKLQTHLSAT